MIRNEHSDQIESHYKVANTFLRNTATEKTETLGTIQPLKYGSVRTCLILHA